jgi:hypothetical protein
MFIVTSVQTIKTASNCNRTLTRDQPAFVHSVLWVRSPVYSLLSSVVYWWSQHWHWSERTVLHRFTGSLAYALCSSAIITSFHSAVNTRSLLYTTHLPAVAQMSIHQPTTKKLFNHSCITASQGPVTYTLNHNWDCAYTNDWLSISCCPPV